MNPARRILPLLALVVLPCGPATSSAQVVRDDFDGTNGPVYALARIGDTLYVGGDFTRSGPHAHAAAGISVNSGRLDGFPRVDGHLLAVASDGAGGWYIGGSFGSVGGVPRDNLAHLQADYSVSPWNPGTNDRVHAIVVGDSTVYVGGYFSQVGGQSRKHVAAVDITTGVVRPWSVDIETTIFSSVRALALQDGTLFMGGMFNAVGGNSRGNVAAVDALNGAILSWSPNISGPVFAIEASDGAVFVGGYFANVTGFPRRNLVAVHPASGLPLSWSADADSTVAALSIGDSELYVGGSFSNIGGQTRSRLAALDIATAAVSTWAPQLHGGFEGRGGAVLDVLVSDSVVYAAGFFSMVGTQFRSGLAAIDRSTATLTSWDPYPYSGAWSLALHDSIIFVGGDFLSIGGNVRNRLAAIDVVTGRTTDWDPNADGAVRALIVSGSTLYAGGSFDSIGGQRRRKLVALDPVSGTPHAWNPGANGTVRALAIRGTTLYAGGSFTAVAGQSRNRLASVDLVSANVTGWLADADSTVRALAMGDSLLYVGGDFHTIGNTARNFVAALDPETGAVADWDARVNEVVGESDPNVYALAAEPGRVYVGGDFSQIGGQSRINIATLDGRTGDALHSSTGLVTTTVYSIAASDSLDGVVYFGSTEIRAFRKSTGELSAWHPGYSNPYDVTALTLDASTVYAGGVLIRGGNSWRAGVAAITADATTSTLLALFQAEPGDRSIVLRWRFGGTEPVAAAWLERATAANGPWIRSNAAVRREGDTFVATDAEVEAGSTYFYRLIAEFPGGATSFGPIEARLGPGELSADDVALASIVPSPTTGPTRIEFALGRAAHVRLTILDVQGRTVATLVDGAVAAGRSQAVWSGRDQHRPAPAGIYFVRFEAQGRSMTKRIAVTR